MAIHRLVLPFLGSNMNSKLDEVFMSSLFNTVQQSISLSTCSSLSNEVGDATKEAKKSGRYYHEISFSTDSGNRLQISYTDKDTINLNRTADGKTHQITLVGDRAKQIYDFVTNMGQIPILPMRPISPFKPIVFFETRTEAENLMNRYKQALETHELALKQFKEEEAQYDQRMIEFKQKQDELLKLADSYLSINSVSTDGNQESLDVVENPSQPSKESSSTLDVPTEDRQASG